MNKYDKTNIYMCVYIYMCMCVCVCVYIYTYKDEKNMIRQILVSLYVIYLASFDHWSS